MGVKMQKIYWFIATWFLVVSMLQISLGSAEEMPSLSTADYVGIWSGKTSQGFPISLKIENINSKVVVTQLGYKIILEGLAWGWDKTTNKLDEPWLISADVINRKFNLEEKFPSCIIELSGDFISTSLLNGTLKETSVHPMDIVTAIGKVTYTAAKE